MNLTSEDVQKYSRIVLYWLAGALASHGIITPNASWLEPVIAVLLTIVNFAWTIYGGRLAGLLKQVEAKDGVKSVDVKVDSTVIDVKALNDATPNAVIAKPSTP